MLVVLAHGESNGDARIADRISVPVRELFEQTRSYFEALDPTAVSVPFPVIRLRKFQGSDRIVASYDRVTRTISTVRLDKYRVPAERLWGLEMDERLYESILVHEFSHHIIESIAPGLPDADQEYIAYVVQFELMDKGLREEVMRSNQTPRLETFLDVNPFTYLYLGSDFGVAAYRYHLHFPDALARFLDGSIRDGLAPYHSLEFWKTPAISLFD